MLSLSRHTDQAEADAYHYGDHHRRLWCWPASALWPPDSLLFRSYLKRDLSALARIAADNSTAPLEFNDPRVAADNLAASCADSPGGSVYLQAGRHRLRQILAPGSNSGCPSAGGPDDDSVLAARA